MGWNIDTSIFVFGESVRDLAIARQRLHSHIDTLAAAGIIGAQTCIYGCPRRGPQVASTGG
jgi:hypothetical protein